MFKYKSNKFFKSLLYKNGRYYFSYFIIGLIVSYIPLIMGYSLNILIDSLSVLDKNKFVFAIVAMLTLTFLNSIFIYINGLVELSVRFNSRKNMLLSFISLLIESKNYNYADNGKILNISFYDFSAMEYSLCTIIDFLNKILFFVISIAILMGINFYLTIFVIIPLAVLNVLIYFLRNKYKNYFDNQRNDNIVYHSFIYDSVKNIEAVKYFIKKENYFNELNNLSIKSYKSRLNSVIFQSIINNGVLFVNDFSIFLILILCIRYVLNNELTSGQITLFISYIGYGFVYLTLYTNVISNYKYSQSLLERIENIIGKDLINKFIHLNISKDFQNIEQKINSLSFESFGIGENSKKIDFTVKIGDLVVITGENGSGKSTFLDTIVGINSFYGKIKLNNLYVENLEKIKIGYVSQKNKLFDMNLEKNITWCDKDIDISKILTDSNIFQDSTFLLKDSVKQTIGKNGANLSEGQKQRLLIARAIYNSSEILCLDDSFSFMDKYNRKKILKNLLAKDKIIFLATEDENIIEMADIVVYMKARVIDKLKE